jgi:YHS domain-containing protein
MMTETTTTKPPLTTKLAMKGIQQVEPSPISGKSAHVFRAKCTSALQLTIKFSVMLAALIVLSANNGAAAPINSQSDRAITVFKALHPQMQVWAERRAGKVNVDSNGVILKGYDPVAYFTQKKAVKGDPKYQTKYQGAIYYFSSAANLATFKKNPSKYAPQFGAFCANGVRNKQLNDSDPNVFFIVKGKLYVCASPAAEKEFRANEDEDIVAANRAWQELVH